jgi:hypothetical protein
MSTPADPDDYDYGRPPGWFTRLLWACAGADEQILVRCPNSDRVKYQGLGGVVLATGVLAFLSGSYAFYTVFSPKVGTALAETPTHVPSAVAAVAAGAVWALIIFNIERFIVSSTGKGDGTDAITWDELVKAFPRIVMAVIISFAMSGPLETRVLQSEIAAQLELEQREHARALNESSLERVATRKAELLAKIDASQGRLDERSAYFEQRRQEIVKQRKDLEAEAEGLTGSGKAGRGPAWQDKKDTLDKLERELEADRAADGQRSGLSEGEIGGWKKEIDELDAALEDEKEKNAKAARQLDGLLARIRVAEEIGGGVVWAIRLLLLCVELGPIFFKMMVNRSAYDYLEENQKRLVRARAGIEPDAKIFSEAGGKEHRADIHHAELAVVEEQRRRAATERVLAEVVHEEYVRRTTEEIRKDPEKFVGKGSA